MPVGDGRQQNEPGMVVVDVRVGHGYEQDVV